MEIRDIIGIFRYPLLENPIRGNEQKLLPSTVVLSIRGSGHCIPSFVVDFSRDRAGDSETAWCTDIGWGSAQAEGVGGVS
jgi:hypothetical protein